MIATFPNGPADIATTDELTAAYRDRALKRDCRQRPTCVYQTDTQLGRCFAGRTTKIDYVGKALLHQRLAECPDAAMVREEQNLIGLAELSDEIERGPAALIIEMHQNVVCDEGQRLRRTGIILKTR